MARERKQRPAPGTPKPRRSTRVLFASTILTFEAFVMFFAGIAMAGTHRDQPSALWILGGAFFIAALCIYTCTLLKKPLGYSIGWLIQIAMILFGFVEPMMFLIGVLFGVTWWYGVTKGRAVDIENKERDKAQAEWEKAQGFNIQTSGPASTES